MISVIKLCAVNFGLALVILVLFCGLIPPLARASLSNLANEWSWGTTVLLLYQLGTSSVQTIDKEKNLQRLLFAAYILEKT